MPDLNKSRISADENSAWLALPSGERINFGEICTIGRSASNNVVIASERVSRRHAVVRRAADGSFQVMDLGSSNGTYVDGQRLERPTQLRNGAEIEIGLQKMVFRAPISAVDAVMSPEPTVANCWLLVLDAGQLGERSVAEDVSDKTFESWNERCQRVISKYRGRTTRALHEGLLASWPSEGGDGNAPLMATVLRSIRALQMHTEEFRCALHFGSVELTGTATGGLTPTGPEVIHALELQRIGGSFNKKLLISAAAETALGGSLATRQLLETEIPDYGGSEVFFTLVDDVAGATPLNGSAGSAES